MLLKPESEWWPNIFLFVFTFYAIYFVDELTFIAGPIIRVNPNELHIDDPSFYDQLYNFSPDIDRPKVTLGKYNLQNSPSFDLHRVRRKALDPYFSKTTVLKLEDVVASCVIQLCHWFHQARNTGSPLDVGLLARSLTSDVITEYLFAKPYGFLEDPVKSEVFFAANNSIFQIVFMLRESWIVAKILNAMQAIPPSCLPAGPRSFVPFVKMNFEIQTVRDRINLSKVRREKGLLAAAGHRVMFDDWDTLELPPQDKSAQAQEDNALLFVSAGFETTGFAIETAIYHVLANQEILEKLKQEISPLIASSKSSTGLPSWTELEKLPYLTAVIHESLRMSLGVSSRLPRKNSKSDMVYKDWVIPKGQFVGMTQTDILYNADIYPDPKRFDPERWLKGEESKELLNKYLVTFSKGARRCIGMHLAYAELFLMLAAVFGQFDLELYQTTRKDVDPVIDYFIPKPDADSKGVRVLVE
ncbi:hypothetical protein H2200_004386 [Cladophialophora chaetospira]|uniref:Trichodiene oxygenase n=1 Tax=Cladophialophora chaetospira TaxID=386627 RepID=A0AA38XD16_9EURO|nr:hypothetical protein H2200_004386 [Cladophialophora chaetospira]